MLVYQLNQKVLFQHCDPAGIVFYPRYFEMINATVEQWFSEALDYSFAKMHITEKVGVPTVAIESNFKAPSFLEDQLVFNLSVLKIGTASLDLTVLGYCAEQLRLECKITLVFVDLKDTVPRSLPWPAHLRDKFTAYLPKKITDKE